MTDYMDFFSEYVMGSVQVLTGLHFFFRFLQKKVKLYSYVLFALLWAAILKVIPTSRITDFLVYTLMLTVGGILACHAECKSYEVRNYCNRSGAISWLPGQLFLYSALTVEIMQLSYGIVNSLLSILYPVMLPFDQRTVGAAFMLLGNIAALLLAMFCYHMTYRYFANHETVQKQYILIALTPVLMIFLMGEYISSVLYGNTIATDGRRMTAYTNHYQTLVIQLLGMASLFCVMFAYKKLLQNFRLNTELLLLEQEEHSLSRYVEEAKSRYEKTKSFRHDIKNHIMVVKELLQNEKTEQALNYIGDMEGITEELSFSCSTNNPVADILIGNKFETAKSMGIDVCCSLHLPYPCFVRDIDLCIILSNALDNAIHACKSINDGEEKYIRVAGRIQGDFVLIEVENSFQGKETFTMGTGLSNIKMTAEKYQGAMSIKTQNASFILSVLLIIPQHSENISQQIG